MKGHAVLLDAAERLARLGIRDFTLVFIGSAPPQQEHFAHTLHELVAASPIGGRVVMIDFMPDLRDAYAALDIVCVPSTEAECMAAISTWEPATQEGAWHRGASMYEPATPTSRTSVDAGEDNSWAVP